VIDDATLNEWQAVCDAATEGPWSTDKPPKDRDGWAQGVVVAATERGQCVYCSGEHGVAPEANRKFIALARTVVPHLIAEVRRLRAERGIYCTGCGVLITREMDDADKRLVATQEHVAQCQSHPLYQAVSELNAVTADRDRLRRELDDTKAQLEACEIWRDRLRVEAAKARQTECPNCDRLQRELDEARAQVAKGKP